MKNNISSMRIENFAQKMGRIMERDLAKLTETRGLLVVKDKQINELLIINDKDIKEGEILNKSMATSMNISEFSNLMKSIAEYMFGRTLNSKDITVVKASEMNDNNLMGVNDNKNNVKVVRFKPR